MASPLSTVLSVLGDLAPLGLAAPWDNVGLLLEPLEPREVSRLFLTIDLDERVLDEAVASEAELIVAYHPPIFEGLKRLTRSSSTARVLLRAAEHRMALYSPHTALDAVPGGVNDWLVAALGEGDTQPIEPAPSNWLAQLPGAGMGRRIALAQPLSLADLVTRVKHHLGLSHVRVAAPLGELALRTAAVCAGAGGSMLSKLTSVDVLLTGEMRHHDVLAAVSRGQVVVLCDHTNTERGFLPGFAERLRQASGLEVVTSSRDADPLVIH
jgi:dinuclear metal center YbgI/SA1388 family protein